MAQTPDFRPEVGAELRVFASDPQFADQFETAQGALILTGEGSWRSRDRDTRVLFEPFVRIDGQDAARTYADLREASLSHRIDQDWDVLVGVSQVFWGVAESRNVVDVINQFDTVEDIDEGEKLGQLLLRLTRRSDVGTFEVYYLPFFRERPFPGPDGRLRTEPAIETGAARYERGGEAWAGDVALRYTNRFGGFDLGVHGFHGTSRNPRIDFDPATQELQPFYPALTQVGLDVQYTSDAWLLKGEIAVAEILSQTVTSAVGGFEYTVFDVSGSGWDVGVIGEYLSDDRDQARLPSVLFDNDVFAGARLTLNDTQDTTFLAGAIVDHRTGGTFASAEFQRRIGDTVLLEVEARAFAGADDPFIVALEADDHVLVRLTQFF